jgi:hypothetical protein
VEQQTGRAGVSGTAAQGEVPQRDEAASYYFRYIDRVGAGDVVAALEGQLEPALSFLREFSEEDSLYRYAPEKWSVREVLNHVSDAERLFAFRAFWFARGFESPLPSFEQADAAKAARADAAAWSSHVEEFRSTRLATVSLFRNLPTEAWSRRGIASDNPFTVRALAFITAGHLIHHVDILRERYRPARPSSPRR